MDVISTIFIVFLTILTIFYAYFKYSFEYWKSRGIPHDKPSIPYGNALGIETRIQLGILMKRWYDKYKPTGAKLCGAYFFTRPQAILLDLELVKNVLVKDFANFEDRGIFYNEKDQPLSATLFALDGDKWRQLRSKLTPTFTSGKMKFMFPTIVEVGEQLRDCLLGIVQQNNELEIKELMARFTTDVIGKCAFGIDCNSLKDPNAEFRHYGRLVFSEGRHSFLVTLFLHNFRNFCKAIHLKRLRDDVLNFFMKVVHETVEYREKNNIQRNDFMDLLIKLKNEEKSKSITLNELAAQCYVFFLGGFETSSTTLTFCLYELALNTEIQSKARRIIQGTSKKYDGQLTYEMIMDMPYIDQILEETLRKYPPGAILSRMATKNYLVPGSNIVIEKGTKVFIPVYGIHHDPEYYPNPEIFDPDRFSVEEKKRRDPMCWLAFGDGPRNCIALRFGMMQARVGLVMLLNNFQFDIGSKNSVPLISNSKSRILSLKKHISLTIKALKNM